MNEPNYYAWAFGLIALFLFVYTLRLLGKLRDAENYGEVVDYELSAEKRENERLEERLQLKSKTEHDQRQQIALQAEENRVLRDLLTPPEFPRDAKTGRFLPRAKTP